MNARYTKLTIVATLAVMAFASAVFAGVPGGPPSIGNIIPPPTPEQMEAVMSAGLIKPIDTKISPEALNSDINDTIPESMPEALPGADSVREIAERIAAACDKKPEGCKETYFRPNEDDDKDLILNHKDNCPLEYNVSQSDYDGDGFGDRCDVCPYVADPEQIDSDGDGFGDICLSDADGDQIPDRHDACPREPERYEEDQETPLDGELDGCDNFVKPNSTKAPTGPQDFLFTQQTEGGCTLAVGAIPAPNSLMQAFLVAFALSGLAISRASRR